MRNNVDYILMKFISKKEFLDDFLKGSLYMNSLYYFWNEYPLEVAKRKKKEILVSNPEINPDELLIPLENSAPAGQMDLFEGTISTADGDKMGFEKNFTDVLMTDIMLRSIGYKYCNVLCFYRLDLTITPFGRNVAVKYNLNSQMNEFGEYVVIIDDEVELLRRINTAIKKEANYRYLCGSVNYRKFKKSGTNARNGNSLTVKVEMEVDITEEPLKSAIISRRDCFDKTERYCNQKEWRLALYRGVKSTDAYRLEIGDISDIVHYVRSDNLNEELQRTIQMGIKQGAGGYYGNISRKEMKELFYQLGDNKAEVFGIIG